MNEKPTRIVIFIQRFQAGGAERQASYLANFLVAKGFAVKVLAFGTLQEPAASWFQGIPCIGLGFTEKNIFSKNPSLKTRLKALYDRFRLKKELKRLKPEILMPFTYEPNILAGRMWKTIGAKICIWNQRDEGRYFKETTREMEALQSCTHHVSNSMAGMSFLNAKGIVTPVHIPNAVVIPQACAGDKGPGLKVAMVGNLHVFKDHLTLLKAWKIALHDLKEIQPKPLLYLIGAPGNALPNIQSFIQTHQLESYVKLTGKMDNPEEVLKYCDVSVFSSEKEGLPNAVLEAMALGMPVVATRIPGTMEALGEEYPFLIEPKHPEAFARAIIDLCADASARKKWGSYNKSRVESLFSIERLGHTYLDLFPPELIPSEA